MQNKDWPFLSFFYKIKYRKGKSRPIHKLKATKEGRKTKYFAFVIIHKQIPKTKDNNKVLD